MKEFLKFIIVFSGYFAIAPLLGWVLARSRVAERFALCLLVCMPSWFPSKLTMMLDSVENYRGHTKGFEFSSMVGLGIALTVCAFVKRPPGFRRVPPGLWLYLLYCALSCLSLIPADNRIYGLMAAWKFTSAAFIFIGAFHAFRDEEDLRWVLRTLAGTLIFQALLCLKLRFLDGRWQVHGWFEHQNPMCIWAYLCALPLLAVAFAPQPKRPDTVLYLGAVGATALMILLSVSRGGLGAFVAGAVAVTGLAHLRGVSLQKVAITGLGACAAVAAGMLALDSLLTRIQQDSARENEEDLRPVLNRQSKAMLHDSPVGIGWNNFGVVNSLPNEKYVTILMDWDRSRGFRIIDDNYCDGPLTESLYWLLLSETGYPGFISYVAFLVLTLWWAARGLIRHWNTLLGYFLGGVLVALGLMYLHGSVERVLSQTKNLSAWLIFAGFLARVSLLPAQGNPKAVSHRSGISPFPALPATAVVVAASSRFSSQRQMRLPASNGGET